MIPPHQNKIHSLRIAQLYWSTEAAAFLEGRPLSRPPGLLGCHLPHW